jgi:hypothetical protein
VQGERRVQAAEVVAAVGSLDGIERRAGAEEASEGGFVDDVRDLVGVQDVGEVDEEPRDARDGDALVGRDVAGVQVPGPVEPDARLIAALVRADDVDEGGAIPPHASQLRCGEKRQRRSLAAACNPSTRIRL